MSDCLSHDHESRRGDSRRNNQRPTTRKVRLVDAPHGQWDSADREAEGEVIKRYAGLVHRLVERYARPGVDRDDLVQVGMTALLLAHRRFDPQHGANFTTFAWSTISGELKRHRRSTGWGLRVPRRIQEAFLEVANAAEELVHELGRSPTVAELARRTGLTNDEVVEALDARGAVRPLSIDAPGDDEEEDDGAWRLGRVDPAFVRTDEADLLRDLLTHLTERERAVVDLRFNRGMAQREVGRELGVSQMQVSRILSTAVEKMRRLATPG